MNEKILPPRLMVLLVVLKGEKVYKMDKEPSLEPMESSIIREALYLLTPQLP
jgi:hypothetical protein